MPVATPLLEQPEPEAEQPSDTSGVIPGSGIYWELGVMYAVGRSIPSELRETSLGGMAVAKSACENCMACANKRNKMKK